MWTELLMPKLYSNCEWGSDLSVCRNLGLHTALVVPFRTGALYTLAFNCGIINLRRALWEIICSIIKPMKSSCHTFGHLIMQVLTIRVPFWSLSAITFLEKKGEGGPHKWTVRFSSILKIIFKNMTICTGGLKGTWLCIVEVVVVPSLKSMNLFV